MSEPKRARIKQAVQHYDALAKANRAIAKDCNAVDEAVLHERLAESAEKARDHYRGLLDEGDKS